MAPPPGAGKDEVNGAGGELGGIGAIAPPAGPRFHVGEFVWAAASGVGFIAILEQHRLGGIGERRRFGDPQLQGRQVGKQAPGIGRDAIAHRGGESRTAPCAMPSDMPAVTKENSGYQGRRKSGPGLSLLPGCGPPGPAVAGSERCAGTKTSSTATSLLPVPASPITYQVSMTRIVGARHQE